MAAPRSMVDALLEQEARQVSAAAQGGDTSNGPGAPGWPSRRLNAVWRQKVAHWYFIVIAVLRRQHAATSKAGARNPFDRASVHVTASLLDVYLASLPKERAARYKHDWLAYQLLATACLLLGMRLAQHDQIKEARQREVAAGKRKAGEEEDVPRGLKRAKTHRTNMNEASSATTITAGRTPQPPAAGVHIPNAATLLRISAAPRSISEQHVLCMVREMTASRAFPRSKLVTSLDFIQALCSASTQVTEDGSSVVLGPADAEDASRLADAAVRNANFVGCRPSVLACAAIALALARSSNVNLSMASLRQKVHYSIFGDGDDLELQASIRRAEFNLLECIQARVLESLNRRSVPTTHLIPLEDDCLK